MIHIFNRGTFRVILYQECMMFGNWQQFPEKAFSVKCFEVNDTN